jgi:Beta-lactamase
MTTGRTETIRRYGIVFTRPGETFDYSNLGFGILGQIIADVSGRSFQGFVHDEVLRPLAMVHAWAGAAPKSRHPVAPRYNSQLKTFSPPHPEPRLPGSSVLYCSAHELSLFGMFHLKVRHPRQKAILTDAAIDRLQEPAVTAGRRRQSLAWSINDNQHGYRTLLAQGGTSDSQAWLLLVPSERIVVVVLANAGNVAVSSTIDRILSLMLPAYRENLAAAVPPNSAGTAAATASPSAVPSEIVGTWSGEIHTHRGNVPLALTITSSSDIAATLGKQPPVNMTDVRTTNDRVVGRMHGDLGVDYVGTAPYQLRFALQRIGNKLIGSAVTYAADVGRLPLWVELRRGENK